MSDQDAGRRSPEETQRRWQAVADALTQAADAWREVSPESAGPVEELRDDARWNATYWSVCARGLSELEASREMRQVIGEPSAGRYIDYEGIRDEEAPR